MESLWSRIEGPLKFHERRKSWERGRKFIGGVRGGGGSGKPVLAWGAAKPKTGKGGGKKKHTLNRVKAHHQ